MQRSHYWPRHDGAGLCYYMPQLPRGCAMKEFRLGVLFVHGIGTQPPRDTLVRWGDVLLKVISHATQKKPGRIIPIIGQADAGDRSGDSPAEVVVAFRNDHDE